MIQVYQKRVFSQYEADHLDQNTQISVKCPCLYVNLQGSTRAQITQNLKDIFT